MQRWRWLEGGRQSVVQLPALLGVTMGPVLILVQPIPAILLVTAGMRVVEVQPVQLLSTVMLDSALVTPPLPRLDPRVSGIAVLSLN